MYGVVGVKFRPDEEEIISYYIDGKMEGFNFPFHAINEVDVLEYEPLELPRFSVLPDNRVWRFFNAPSLMNGQKKRAKRKNKGGYWKVTGNDRDIRDDRRRVIGFKKTLVFYERGPTKWEKTNWVVHEYHSKRAPLYQREFVLWRLKDEGSNCNNACNLPSRGLTCEEQNDHVGYIGRRVNHGLRVDSDLLNYRPAPQLLITSDAENDHVTENAGPQVNHGLQWDSLNYSGLVRNLCPELELPMTLDANYDQFTEKNGPQVNHGSVELDSLNYSGLILDSLNYNGLDQNIRSAPALQMICAHKMIMLRKVLVHR